jgi:hypothetical protein
MNEAAEGSEPTATTETTIAGQDAATVENNNEISPTDTPDNAADVSEEEVVQNTQQTAEEIQRQQQEEMAARIEASKTIDPLTYLTRSSVKNEGNSYYSAGHRFFATDTSLPISNNFKLRIGNIHIAGQALIKYVAPHTVFSLEDFQKAYNNVPLIDGTEEAQALLTKTAITLSRLAWESGQRYIDALPIHLDNVLSSNAALLRVPATKDGGEFQGVDILFNPMAGQFRPDNIGGIVLRYEGEQNHYALLFNDFADPNDELGFAVRVFVSELLQFRNYQTDAFIHGDLNNILQMLLAEIGEELKAPPAQPSGGTEVAANDPDGAVAGDESPVADADHSPQTGG